MSSGLMILIGIHGVSLLLLCAMTLEYDHVRKKYVAFLSALDRNDKRPLLKRSFLMYAYLAVILSITLGTTVLFLWQPHFL